MNPERQRLAQRLRDVAQRLEDLGDFDPQVIQDLRAAADGMERDEYLQGILTIIPSST